MDPAATNSNFHHNSNSVAQTPCFAETPNTTNQFKGYTIDGVDLHQGVKIVIEGKAQNVVVSRDTMQGFGLDGERNSQVENKSEA